MFYGFLVLLSFLVLLASSLTNEVVMLYVCLVCLFFVTKLGFAENAINIVVSAHSQQPKMAKHCQILKVRNWSKHKSKAGPTMLRNTIGPVLDFVKMVKVDLFIYSPCRKKEENKQKRKNKSWTIFRPLKTKMLDKFLTLQRMYK